MLGRPEWFERRKYGGWGITPKNWKGWVYAFCMIVPYIVFQIMPFWDDITRLSVTALWIVLLLVDTLDIMIRLRMDEREMLHEAISERNAMWIMTVILIIGLVYQIIVSSIEKKIMIDWWIVIALTIGLIVKAFSNYYLERKN